MSHKNTLSDIFSRVDIQPGGCWLWTGSLTKKYGHTRWQGKLKYVHRLVYEALVKPIPDGLQLDHLCRVERCCNPSHLEPVTNQENVLRGKRGRMITHCPQGHEYNEENTGHRRPSGRYCRACRKTRNSQRAA